MAGSIHYSIASALYYIKKRKQSQPENPPGAEAGRPKACKSGAEAAKSEPNRRMHS
jgi:hypothetical protein